LYAGILFCQLISFSNCITWYGTGRCRLLAFRASAMSVRDSTLIRLHRETNRSALAVSAAGQRIMSLYRDLFCLSRLSVVVDYPLYVSTCVSSSSVIVTVGRSHAGDIEDESAASRQLPTRRDTQPTTPEQHQACCTCSSSRSHSITAAAAQYY